MAFMMDAGFWYASIDSSDHHYLEVAPVADSIHETIVVPIPVITETAYLILKNLGVDRLAAFSDRLAVSLLTFEGPVASDYARAAEILRKYNDANIDFVDACIVAMA